MSPTVCSSPEFTAWPKPEGGSGNGLARALEQVPEVFYRLSRLWGSLLNLNANDSVQKLPSKVVFQVCNETSANVGYRSPHKQDLLWKLSCKCSECKSVIRVRKGGRCKIETWEIPVKLVLRCSQFSFQVILAFSISCPQDWTLLAWLGSGWHRLLIQTCKQCLVTGVCDWCLYRLPCIMVDMYCHRHEKFSFLNDECCIFQKSVSCLS